MISTGFEQRIKIQQVINHQLPEFLLDESPKTVDFLKQYYISQEYQGGPIDIAENIDQYLKFDNLTPEVIKGQTSLGSSITESSTTIYVDSTKGFPPEYGLVKIGDEIVTYTGIGTTSFTGCIRGFSAITSYRDPLNPEELIFSTSKASSHSKDSTVVNLSSLFLKEFYRKLKYLFAPGFEELDFDSDLKVNNFIKEIRSFYQSKGTEESFRILFNVLYGITPRILNLEDFLIKPSQSEYIRREVLIGELITPGGDPRALVGWEIKSDDESAVGPVSEVQIVTRNNRSLYKIQLFAGYDEKSLITGNFKVTPRTKVSDFVSVGSSSITVDSTVGFDTRGTFTSNFQTITYTDKNINQFFGCSGITSSLLPGTDLYANKYVYGYENGDPDKKIKLTIVSSISNLENIQSLNYFNDGDRISFGYFGDNITNNNQTAKEILANSWVYNTRSRYEIKNYSNFSSELTLYETPDKSSLRVNDYVDILKQNSEDIVLENVVITKITNNIVNLDTQIVNVFPGQKLSIRRKYNYASSSYIPLEYSKILSDVQNTYVENDQYFYVASNSLPSAEITKNKKIIKKVITESTNLDDFFDGQDLETFKYSTLSFDNNVPFITGDSVIYNHTSISPIRGLIDGEEYYVEVLSSKNKIKLYGSRSFIPSGNYIELEQNPQSGEHKFTLTSHLGKSLYSKKSLYKFPIEKSINYEENVPTEPGVVGTLINGVEILSYKSDDAVFYGPLKDIEIINHGIDYDVVNPPTVIVSNPVGFGTTALVNLVVRGSIKEVIVDPQQVSIERVLSAKISGGNGNGAVLTPILSKQYREIEFNAAQSDVNGGIDISNETITFLDFHKLKPGEKIIYNSNGNLPLGVGSFGLSNTDQNLYLGNGSAYYPKIVNTKSIQLYSNLSDFNSGINTVGFTTINTGGIHKFRIYESKNVLSSIVVDNPGSGYENRSLMVNSSGINGTRNLGISTITSSVIFENHGFNDGDLINYSTTKNIISGLSTSNQYYILKTNNNEFKLADAGDINVGISKTDYTRRNFVKFNSKGSGYQIFSYPKITVKLEVEYSGFIGTITATPIVRGEIVDAYLYESGTNYGSNILNFHKRPNLKIQNGSGAQLKPIVINGKIVAVEVQSKGVYYPQSIELSVIGSGLGAKLRPVIVDGKIISVVVINSGIGYNSNTRIKINSPGKNLSLRANVRPLIVNTHARFSDEILSEYDGNLSYGVVGYSTDREGVLFSDPDPNTKHSKIIGWCRDGNPIYGPYGYLDPTDFNSEIVRVRSGYQLDASNVFNRPTEFDFPPGYFNDDYIFRNVGELDINNGRFTKTPEFPYGTYAYHVGVSTDSTSGNLIPQFPYFIGEFYTSKVEKNFISSQNKDLDDSILVRNTFPYRENKDYSGNDFLPQISNDLKQTSTIRSTKSGKVERIGVVNSGSNYAVGESFIFDNEGTSGDGASAEIYEIYGRDIVKIETEFEDYSNVVFTWKDSSTITANISPYHELLNEDVVEISGISTFIKGLVNSHKISVDSKTLSLTKSLSSAGLTTDIYVSVIPKNIGVGNTLLIESEIFSILNIFENQKVIRLRRGGPGVSHTSSSFITLYPSSFDIKFNSDYFDSATNDIVYFNPTKSIGVGIITGSSIETQYQIGASTNTISIPTQSIYLPNHPFKNNQRILYTGTGSAIQVSNSANYINTFNLQSGSYVYIINKSKDYIGIVTQVGLTTYTNGLFFTGNGSDNNYQYKFESSLNQLTGSVKKIKTLVSVSTDHYLTENDQINLIANPNLSLGVGTFSSVKVKYNSLFNMILVDPIGFSFSRVDISNNLIGISSHGIKTGQKVFYSTSGNTISGLTTGQYYAYKIDNDNIKLSQTYLDAISNPPTFIDFNSVGGSIQEISKVSPQIVSVKNNNLVFDLTDSSLYGYDFNLFYNKEFTKKFVSVGNTSIFTVEKYGEVGINTQAKCTIHYNSQLPQKIYYTLTKNNIPIFTNFEENDYKISFVDSSYIGNYKISGIGLTTFYISLKSIPERLSYVQSECDVLKYTTNSKTTKGPISKVKILSGGYGYKGLPNISGIVSTSSGKNAVIDIDSQSIGKVGLIDVINDGYYYASDRTLRPKANIDRLLILKEYENLIGIEVIDGGKNYISPPKLILVNTSTRNEVYSGFLKPNLGKNGISFVDIVEEPKGLDSVVHQVFAITNSNGANVVGVNTYVDGVVECTIRTPPVTGFSVPPFAAGDLVFIEGIEKKSYVDDLGNTYSPGDGYNSSDHGYNFFRVVEFINSDPAVLKYDLSPYTLYPGDVVTNQTAFNSAVNYKNYPKFKLKQTPGNFFENETLLVNNVTSDVKVKYASNNYLKITNTNYIIKTNDVVKGLSSGNIARVGQIFEYDGRFTLDASTENKFGWNNDVGKLNLSNQVIADNDYYQTLSYSVQSPIEYRNFIDSVNRLVHPIGIKNFADTGITSSSKTSIGSSETLLITLDFIEEKRVDTIRNFDLVYDYEPTKYSSSYIKFKSKKLTDYIKCSTNRVLQIDDISNIFSSSEFNKDTFTFLESIEYPITDFYSKFLVQISDQNNQKYQINEIIVINDFNSTYTLNKSEAYSLENLGTFSGEIGAVGDPVLKFIPADPYNTSYKLKIYKESFNPRNNNIGVGFTDIGFVRLSGKTEKLLPQIGVTTTVFRGLSDVYNSIYSNSLIIDTDNNILNYYEVIGCYDGTNTHIAEYYYDSDKSLSGLSNGYIGTFGLNVSDGIISLKFTNGKNNNVVIKTKTVGFGTTASGISTYRFLSSGQPPGSEATTRLESKYDIITGITTIKSFDSSIISSLKSLIKVSVGSTIALHEILVVSDQLRTTIMQYPFITANDNSGIGTFTTSTSGSVISVKFNPDSKFASSKILVQSFDQSIYAGFDEYNVAERLFYGTVEERFTINKYGSLNNYGKDRLNFDLNYNKIPIFEKSFNPADSQIFNKESGIITIPNHFFQDGEELIYTPDSTFVGVAGSAVGIGSTIVGGVSFIGDFISGFATVTGVASSTGISTNGTLLIGANIPQNTTILSIGRTYSYFTGNVVSGGSTVITGIANTELMVIGAGIFSGNSNSLGTIVNIGINSITSTNSISAGSNRLYYTNTLNTSLKLSRVSTGTTFRKTYSSGIITYTCPSKVYAIKIDENKIKLSGVSGGLGIGFTFTSVGFGNFHKLEMSKKLEKTIITINGVTQYPLAYTPVTYALSGNKNGSVGLGVTFISLTGISTISPKDVIKIKNEYMVVSNVGFGTTSSGPINGIGTVPIVQVVRSSLGSSESSYSDGELLRVYKGSYNISGNKIWFSQAPDGKGDNTKLSDTYLPSPKSTFNGRVFLRQDYEQNQIYDDISANFTGIGRTFTLYKEGGTISNVVSGNNLVFINDVFQTPDTENNSGNNYKILNSNSGISSISFTSVTIPNTDNVLIVDSDVNQNEVPRGGLIVSLASTGGLGCAPLVGIPTGMLDVKVGNTGQITFVGFTSSIIVGIATTGNIGVTTDRITGITTRNVRVQQKIIDIPSTDISGAIIPDLTRILRFGTVVSSIGIGTIFLSKLTTNTTAFSTSFGFNVGQITGSGYNRTVSVGVTAGIHTGTPATITANIGAGGSISSFNIVNGGSWYTNPIVSLSDPSYQDLPIVGKYKVGIGSTSTCGVGLSISLKVTASSKVGIGSTYFEVSSFEITKPGYGFGLGDVFSVVGLVTDSRLSSPIQELQFTVADTRTDTFSSWQVGEFDNIDNIKPLQDGRRIRFPLYKNNELLSFEKDPQDMTSSLIDFDSILLIYVNGVMQEPSVSYIFEGGTTFIFREPPRPEDNISIFFYRGTTGVDSFGVNIKETLKPGDALQINKNENIPTTVGQDERTISFITSSDVVETGIYLGDGIDSLNPKPVDWIKQKTDLIVNEVIQYKERDSIESMVFPTAKVIKSFDSSSTEIFVDNAQFFNYEENESNSPILYFSGLVVPEQQKVPAKIIANLFDEATLGIGELLILDPGSGYSYTGAGSSVRLKIRSIANMGGTDAVIYASVSPQGTITVPFDIVDPGSHYDPLNIPEIIAPLPSSNKELITKIRFVQGFAGIITGITTTAGIGTNLAIKFFVKYDQNSSNDDLISGYPIIVSGTSVGDGIISIKSKDSEIVGIGSESVDNIYYINSITRNNLNGTIVSNIISTTEDLGGINTFGSKPCGKFSWGRLSGLTRSPSPISINIDSYTFDVGLTTYPTIQRRDCGLRDTGALRKNFN